MMNDRPRTNAVIRHILDSLIAGPSAQLMCWIITIWFWSTEELEFRHILFSPVSIVVLI